MSKATKTLDRVLRGNADANIRFGDLRTLLAQLGFAERIRGDHHIFTREGVEEILNVQPRAGKAKAYQVKQVRTVIVAYGLAPEAAEPPDKKDEKKPSAERNPEQRKSGHDEQ
ncbi:MAG TPA: type II toxin-antitoxin system HicA family toxin [Pirellulaceae bacterium]|nr:type II toxin-antitoxin system HicA family toxin [Pirellulaceae bacterium]